METWAIQVKNQKPTTAEFQNFIDASQDWWVLHAMVWKEGRSWHSRVYFRGHFYPKRVLPTTSEQIQTLITSTEGTP